MKAFGFIFALLGMTAVLSCDNGESKEEEKEEGKVLLLKVDCLKSEFESGSEVTLSMPTKTFTLDDETVEPSDFGYIKLFCTETNDTIFHGTVVWMGVGEIIHPEKWTEAGDFEVAPERNIIIPSGGFENACEQGESAEYDDEWVSNVWGAVQQLKKVREYIAANPDQKIKVLRYQPEAGGSAATHDKWILFVKR
ncbi:MAG: hypothetical protein LBT42_06115 [Tannerella sp.]|jgi:hypothetical protein|nr:hypothetical protein [Tannerella sp.]